MILQLRIEAWYKFIFGRHYMLMRPVTIGGIAQLSE